MELRLKVEDVSEDKIKLVVDKELFDLALRTAQLYTRYVALELAETLVYINWDRFFNIVDIIKLEFDARQLSVPITIIRLSDRLQGLEMKNA